MENSLIGISSNLVPNILAQIIKFIAGDKCGALITYILLIYMMIMLSKNQLPDILGNIFW